MGDPTLPSALRRFTAEFGMGSGGTTALLPPDKFCLFPFSFSSLNQNLNLKQAACPSPFGFSLLENNFISLKHLRCCQVKPHGSLVLVSSTYRYAYTQPINVLVLNVPLGPLKSQGRLISRQVSRLDAFSGYLFRT